MNRIFRMLFVLSFIVCLVGSITPVRAESLLPVSPRAEIEQMRHEQRMILRAAIRAAYKPKPIKQVVRLTENVITGYAPHYGVGVMERVSRVRKLPIVPCMVSSPYQRIGTWVQVVSLIDGDTLTCRVTDVSADKDRPRHIASHWAVELDFTSAKTLCNISRVGQEPARKCPVQVTVIDKSSITAA